MPEPSFWLAAETDGDYGDSSHTRMPGTRGHKLIGLFQVCVYLFMIRKGREGMHVEIGSKNVERRKVSVGRC